MATPSNHGLEQLEFAQFDDGCTDEDVAFPALDVPVHDPEKVAERLRYIAFTVDVARSVAKANRDHFLADHLDCEHCGGRKWTVASPWDCWKFKCAECGKHHSSKYSKMAAMQLVALAEKGAGERLVKITPATLLQTQIGNTATLKRLPSLKI